MLEQNRTQLVEEVSAKYVAHVLQTICALTTEQVMQLVIEEQL
jgi:hypothetical protein